MAAKTQNKSRRKPAAKGKAAQKAARQPAAKPAAVKAPPLPVPEMLRRLTEAVAVSGDESAVRKLIREWVAGHADEVRVDTLGNLTAVKKSKARDALRVMVAAHMDEVGVMIVGLDSDGLLKFETVGSLDERILLGKPMWVGSERVPGVIGARPIHLLKGNEIEQVVKADALRIDIGTHDKDAAGRKVKVGDRAAFATLFTELGRIVRGKAMDDRLGCAALVELLRGGPYACDLHAVFTVQEEIGTRGAKVAAFAIDPDAAFALDCTPAHDVPGEHGEENVRPNTYLGRGPAIYLADAATLSDKRLVEHVVKVAELRGLPFQYRQPGGGGTDAGAIHVAREGVPSLSVSVPGRYIHSPAALVSLDDFENTVKLMRSVLETLTPRAMKR